MNSITFYPNKKQYYIAKLKNAFRWIIPFWIKTPALMQMGDDKQIVVEKVSYIFGWSWKRWQWSKLTGRIYKVVSKQPITPEQAQDHYAITGEDLLKSKKDNIIVYSQDSFTPYEYEPYMDIKTKIRGI
jgi:hypothetical protein